MGLVRLPCFFKLCTTYRKIFNDVVKDDKNLELVHLEFHNSLKTGPQFHNTNDVVSCQVGLSF
jgi:hypothetical protein